MAKLLNHVRLMLEVIRGTPAELQEATILALMAELVEVFDDWTWRPGTLVGGGPPGPLEGDLE